MSYEKIKKANSALLNKPDFGSTAAISWQIVLHESNYLTGNIAISDCHKVITLDIYTDNDIKETKGFDNSIHKLDTLIKNLKNCKEELINIEKIRRDYEKLKIEEKKKKLLDKSNLLNDQDYF